MKIMAVMHDAAKENWVRHLRSIGVKAAHQDEGWVDREHNEISFTYPDFYDDPGVGDVVALGWPDKHRIVVLTSKRTSLMGIVWWSFKDAR